jgi:protein-L-isoaspartate(D-aspartate) O-methyltransferase
MKPHLFIRFTTIAVLMVIFFLLIYSAPSPVLSQGKDKVQSSDATDKSWKRPRFSEFRQDRLMMVDSQIARHRPAVRKGAVLEAMRQVPRHLFVPSNLQRVAYSDRPLPIGYGQTISQPYIVALMTETLEVEPGAKVLEVGTGSGYQAAVLSELTSNVFTMEIIRTLGEKARRRLQSLGYESVKVRIGDGYFGWPEEAPFDGIIVTAAAGHIPAPLIEQLRPGGRMVIPVGGIYQVQRLMVVTKDDQGRVQTQELLPVVFVPMTGAVQKTR